MPRKLAGGCFVLAGEGGWWTCGVCQAEAVRAGSLVKHCRRRVPGNLVGGWLPSRLTRRPPFHPLCDHTAVTPLHGPAYMCRVDLLRPEKLWNSWVAPGLHCEVPPDHFCSICQHLSKKCGFAHLGNPPGTLTRNTSDPAVSALALHQKCVMSNTFLFTVLLQLSCPHSSWPEICLF